MHGLSLKLGEGAGRRVMRQFGQFGRNRGIALGLAPEQVFQATVRDHRGLRLREACLAQEPLKVGKFWHRTVCDASLECGNSRLVIGGRGDDGDFSQVQLLQRADPGLFVIGVIAYVVADGQAGDCASLQAPVRRLGIGRVLQPQLTHPVQTVGVFL
ncbi:hypothetical protein G6F65_021582 [Rhizopus arrhizus]|nr:hypothetical protein G6F65_021582 [Rhizopus arrhizus]